MLHSDQNSTKAEQQIHSLIDRKIAPLSQAVPRLFRTTQRNTSRQSCSHASLRCMRTHTAATHLWFMRWDGNLTVIGLADLSNHAKHTDTRNTKGICKTELPQESPVPILVDARV
eukprot:2733273-Amphidinium_carterae.1